MAGIYSFPSELIHKPLESQSRLNFKKLAKIQHVCLWSERSPAHLSRVLFA